MNILGIDTTTKVASCSVLYNNKFYTKSISNEITHSEKLLPIIDESLNLAKTNLDNIDMFATINGPGSFTGIRIGLATIKAFAQVKEINIFSISSIDLIGYTAFKKYNLNDQKILSLIDARNNRVYYALNKISKDENGKITFDKILDVDNDTIDNVISKINEKDIIIAGNCINSFKEKLNAISEKSVDVYPTTEDLISCYLDIKNPKDYIYNAYSLDALYARQSQAERINNNR